MSIFNKRRSPAAVYDELSSRIGSLSNLPQPSIEDVEVSSTTISGAPAEADFNGLVDDVIAIGDAVQEIVEALRAAGVIESPEEETPEEA